MYALEVVAPVLVRHGWNGSAGWWILFPLFWVAVIVVVTVLIVRARERRRPHEEDRAESILRERYARGEIDETEFRERLETLVAAPRRR